jgi:nicotinamide riboside kinase
MRRINLFGGPHSGKSTNAAFLYFQLKKMGYNVDMVREHAMVWVYEKKEITYFDEIPMFATQLHNEDLILRGGADIIVTDCPLMLVSTYAHQMKCEYWDNLVRIANDFELKYPSINVFLNRGEEYSEQGRLHTKEEAVQIDSMIKQMLVDVGNDFVEINIDDNDSLLSYVLGYLKPN